MASKSFELVIGSDLSINGNQITAPKTGDDTNWTLYLMLLLGSVLGMVITFANMKKRRYKNR